MARPIPCDICLQTTADFLITSTQNGDTLGVGIECLAAWTEALVSQYEAAVGGAPPPDPALDGMPELFPQQDHSAAEEAARAAEEPAELSDEEWEASGQAGAPRGRSEAPESEVQGAEAPVPDPVATDG